MLLRSDSHKKEIKLLLCRFVLRENLAGGRVFLWSGLVETLAVAVVVVQWRGKWLRRSLNLNLLAKWKRRSLLAVVVDNVGKEITYLQGGKE